MTYFSLDARFAILANVSHDVFNFLKVSSRVDTFLTKCCCYICEAHIPI